MRVVARRYQTPSRSIILRIGLVVLLLLAFFASCCSADESGAAPDSSSSSAGATLAQEEEGELDDITVSSVDPDAVDARARRRRRMGTAPQLPKGVSATDDDDDDAGVNDFESVPAVDFDDAGRQKGRNDFGERTDEPKKQQQQPHGNGKKGQEEPKSKPKTSRKEQYRQKQEEYTRQQQQNRDEPPPTTSASPFTPQSTFPVKAPTSKNVRARAQHVHDELRHLDSWLSAKHAAHHQQQHQNSDRKTAGDESGDLDEVSALRAAAVRALPLPLIPGAEMTHILQSLEAAVRRAAKVRRDCAAAAAASSSSKKKQSDDLGTEADVTAALELLSPLDDMAARLREAASAHRAMHRALAAAALGSSPISAGLAKGQLAAADAAMAEIRREDDAGVGNRERRAQRNEIKAVYKLVKEQVDSFAQARRVAQKILAAAAATHAAHAALDHATLETLAFKNTLARQAPASLVDSAQFSLPITTRLTGLTTAELAALFVLTCVPFQGFRLALYLVSGLRGLVGWARRSSARGGLANNGNAGGRRLGSRADVAGGGALSASRLSRLRRTRLFRLAVNLAASLLLSAAVFWLVPDATLPAFPHASPATIQFVVLHALSGAHRLVVVVGVLWIHVVQVFLTV